MRIADRTSESRTDDCTVELPQDPQGTRYGVTWDETRRSLCVPLVSVDKNLRKENLATQTDAKNWREALGVKTSRFLSSR